MIHFARSFFRLIEAATLLAFSSTSFAQAELVSPIDDVSTLVLSQYDPIGTTISWYKYRNTLVALSSNGEPMCITPADATLAQCLQLSSSDLPTMQGIVSSATADGHVMVCSSPAYIEIWWAVPDEPGHWCRAFQNEALTVRADIQSGVLRSSKGTLSRNFSAPESFNFPHVGYLVPVQPAASGPTELVPMVGHHLPPIKVTVLTTNRVTQLKQNIVLEGANLIGCGIRKPMNNNNACYAIPTSQLQLAFMASDNQDLPPGEFVGSFVVEAYGGEDGLRRQPMTIFVDIVNAP